MDIQIFPSSSAVFSHWGFTSSFWEVNLLTLRDTWIAMLVLLGVILLIRSTIKKELSAISFCAQQVIIFFETMSIESFGFFRYDFFSFVASLFFFTFACNLIGLLPFVEEPTRDLNTALAIGLISFVYTQLQHIRAHGFFAFCREFLVIFELRNAFFKYVLSALASMILLPLTLIGEIAKVISMSFRLFGNILGGSILFMIAAWGVQSVQYYFVWYVIGAMLIGGVALKLLDPSRNKYLYYTVLCGMLLAFALTLAQLFFGVFEGLIQAYVVTTLTATYLAIAVGTGDQPSPEEQQ